jgi:acyl carrier protein
MVQGEESPRLVGYVKTSIPEPLDLVGSIKSSLSNILPEHMVPSALLIVDEWPLTPSGKIDRKALPAFDGSHHEEGYVAPGTQTERKLIDMWSQQLNIDSKNIGVTSDFFELGGDSLLSIRLVSSIRSEFDVELSTKTIFEFPYIQYLAKEIDDIKLLRKIGEKESGVIIREEGLL